MAQEFRHAEDAEEYDQLQQIEATATSTYGEKLLGVLKYSSAYLAIIASLQALLALWILSLPLNLSPVVVGLVTFAVYSTDRIADADTDAVAKPRQAEFARKYADVLYFLASLAYSAAVALSVMAGPLALGITLLPGMFWLLYASDWLPALSSQCRRLKDVLFVNTGLVAFAWAFTLTFLPLAFANVEFTSAAAFVFAYFFLGVVVSTEIPNVRDVDEDDAIGVSTLPVVFGIRRTRYLLYGIDLSLLVLVAFSAHLGYLTVPLTTGLVAGIAHLLGVVAFVGRTEKYGRLTIAAESTYVLVVVVTMTATSVV